MYMDEGTYDEFRDEGLSKEERWVNICILIKECGRVHYLSLSVVV